MVSIKNHYFQFKHHYVFSYSYVGLKFGGFQMYKVRYPITMILRLTINCIKFPDLLRRFAKDERNKKNEIQRLSFD